MNIDEIRQKYPEYQDLSDSDLAKGLHDKFYSDIPFDQFSQKIGFESPKLSSAISQQDAEAGRVPEGMDPLTYIREINKIGVSQSPPQQPKTFYEKLFGKPGQQLLPGAEPLKWAIDNPSAVGATIASVAAPEIAAPAAVARYGPLVSQAVSQGMSRIPLAFIGGGVGNEVGRQVGSVKTDPNAEISDILLDNIGAGARMAGAEALGTAGGAVLSKAAAPGASAFTPEARSLAKFATEKGVPGSPSDFSPNLPAKSVEGTLDSFFPSRLVNDAYRKKAVVRFNQLMTEIPQEVGPIQGNNVISPKAIDEIGGFLKSSAMAGKELSQDFIDTVGKDTVVPTSNTNEVFDKIRKNATDESLINWVSKKSEQLKDATAEQLETALRQVGGIKPKTDKKFLDEIRSAIKSDFEEAGAPMEKLAQSNEAFKSNFALTSKKFVREINDEIARGGDGTGLTVKLFRNGNESFIYALAKEADKSDGQISKETWDSLRAQNLQNMILNSTSQSKKLMGLRIIDGAKLEKILEANKGALQVAYKDKPDTLVAMQNLARLAKSTAGDTKTFEDGIGEAVKGWNATLATAGGGAAAFGHPGGIAGLLVGSATAPLLAKSLMNPNGWAKQWLTTGFEHPTNIDEGLRLGGRLLFQNNNEQ